LEPEGHMIEIHVLQRKSTSKRKRREEWEDK
jgi:hypothetical protein